MALCEPEQGTRMGAGVIPGSNDVPPKHRELLRVENMSQSEHTMPGTQ